MVDKGNCSVLVFLWVKSSLSTIPYLNNKSSTHTLRNQRVLFVSRPKANIPGGFIVCC